MDQEKVPGLTREDFTATTAAIYSSYLRTLDEMSAAAAALVPDRRPVQNSLGSQKKVVQLFNRLFDLLGFAGGLAGAGRLTLKVVATEFAKSAGQVGAMELMYALSRPRFPGAPLPGGNFEQKSGMQAVAAMTDYMRAAHAFLSTPYDAQALGNAARRGPVTVAQVTDFLKTNHTALQGFSRKLASDIWDQVFHGSSLVVPKAGTEFTRLTSYCYEVTRFSILIDAFEHNIQLFTPMAAALNTATFRSGGRVIANVSRLGSLQAQGMGEATAARQLELWTATIAQIRQEDWFGPLFKR